MKKRTTGLAGKIAVLCMVAMIAAGGAYTWRQSNTAVPELTTFVDHDAGSVVIGEEEVPLGGKPEVKKETRKSKKTVTLKKASKKTYTKKSKKTRTSTETKQNGNNQIVVKTTVITEVKQKFKKNSKKKVIITKVTTITETSVQSVGQVQGTSVTQSQGSGQKGEVSIDSIAPKLNSTVLNAYHALGFTVTIDPGVSYTGYFNAKNQAIILKRADDTIYHEAGHFLAFVAGNVDTKADFQAVYKEESSKYAGKNKAYVTKNSAEYFAESFRDYTLNPTGLSQSRPKTYAAITSALSKVTGTQINKIKAAYGPIWN